MSIGIHPDLGPVSLGPALSDFHARGRQVVADTLDPGSDLLGSLVGFKQSAFTVKAVAGVRRVQDECLGTLLDVLA